MRDLSADDKGFAYLTVAGSGPDPSGVGKWRNGSISPFGVLMISRCPRHSSVAELLERLAQRNTLIDSWRAELGQALAPIAELEARLGQTSKNSSKLLSSDELAEPAPKSLRRRGTPSISSSSGAAPAELPPAPNAPEGVTAPAQYGPRITAIIPYLYVGQFLLEWVYANLCTVPVATVDETRLWGARPARGGAHSASTSQYSLILGHDRRGTKGHQGHGRRRSAARDRRARRRALHDTYKTVTHTLRNAHDLLRELRTVIDATPQVPWRWATHPRAQHVPQVRSHTDPTQDH